MVYTNLKLKKALSITEIAVAKTYDFSGSFSLPDELSSFWALIYIKNGQAKINFNGSLINAGREHVIILPPESLFSIRAAHGARLDVFCAAFSCGCRRLYDITGPYRCSDEQIFMLSHILDNAESVFNKTHPKAGRDKICEYSDLSSAFGAEQIIKEYLELLLIDIINKPGCEQYDKENSAAQKMSSEEILFRDICDYLNDNLGNNLSVNDICKKFFISSSGIKKLFSSRGGCGVIKFFHRLKIEKAKEYIQADNMNFTEISEALGFSSLHYFSRYFKITTGVSPTDYLLSQNKP